MHILLIGGSGQLGRSLDQKIRSIAEITVTTRTGMEDTIGLDLTEPDTINAVVDDVQPDLIINAAAYTAVDQAESNVPTATKINATAVGVIGQAARRHGVGVIHYSTDYVFSGDHARPYHENDPVEPVNAYGVTKLLGEQQLANATYRHIVLRTSWVFGEYGKNFALSMKRAGETQAPLRVVNDQFGAPTWTGALAEVTSAIAVLQENQSDQWWHQSNGIYHVTAPDYTTWFDFARAVIAKTVSQQRADAVVPVDTASFPTRARRPKWSVLDSGRLKEKFGLSLPPWKTQLDDMLRALEANTND
ncbi:MAG: dTDP-4-dehydrorhamnose reductase [Limisphaerales bacterium]|jgi:dTDP-4-dehydrorhamnose reductase